MNYLLYRHRRLYRRTLWVGVFCTTLLGALSVRAQGQDAPTSPAQQIEQVAVEPSPAVASSPAPQTPQVTFPAVLPPYGPTGTGNLQGIAQSMSAARFGAQHWPALYQIWQRESGWNPAARNRSSGACGIPQALPCSKIPDMSPVGQITWGINYIAARYGNPTAAWQFWQVHHWY